MHDLPRHLHRLYFSGTNTPSRPLRLSASQHRSASHISGGSGVHDSSPLRQDQRHAASAAAAVGPPDELAHVVSPAEFADHAAECNALAAWRPWETRLANVLRLFYPPLALLFEARRRAVHVARLAQLHIELDHTFLRNTRARALGNCVRFGASRDNTLAWMDILASDVSEDVGGSPIGQPRLPCVIPMSGDGSFACPLRIDVEDPLNVAQLSLLSPDFRKCLQ